MNKAFGERWAFVLLAGVLSAPGPVTAAQAGGPPRRQELCQRLSEPVKFPGFDDPKTTLTEALDALAKRYDLAFDINELALNEADIAEPGKIEIASPNPVPEMHSRLRTVLKKIIRRVSPKATFVVREDRIEVTTLDAVRKEFYPGRTEEVLPPLVQGTFEGKPLDEALKELSQGTGVTVLLDGRSIKEGKTPVTADLVNVPLDTAVRLLADMAGLKAVQVDSVLYVTTPDNARALREEQEILRLEQKREAEKKPPEAAKAAKSSPVSPGGKP